MSTVTPGGQLLEQTARLQALSATLDTLKVTSSSLPPLSPLLSSPLSPLPFPITGSHLACKEELGCFALILNMSLSLSLSVSLCLSLSLSQDEVADHVVKQQPGAKASSDFATFPSTAFVKVRLLQVTRGHRVPSPPLTYDPAPLCPPRHETGRATRCWWAGSRSRAPAATSRSTAWSCPSPSSTRSTAC